MDLKHIRNFSIIAHIDHGKSTLADRMLEITHTIEARKMRDQVLDQMELERERGITIKMTPVRMNYSLNLTSYILNLIDTPGHIDFSYEVSRAIKAVEGTILLVDSTQGIQAQTLSVLEMAQDAGLKIIPVLSKIDSPLARIEEVRGEIVNLLGCIPEEVLEVSGKTGQGVNQLLEAIIEKIPSPKISQGLPLTDSLQALVFDFKYSNHKGVIVYVRMFGGEVRRGEQLLFAQAVEKFIALEVGVFTPAETPKDYLASGEIGYIVTGIKQPGIASVGDTVTSFKKPASALSGYMSPLPVVWASVYPESGDDFPILKSALSRLKLSDSAFTYEEESSGALGRGFRCGFLGMLHLEIITERLKREFNLKLIITTPSITYKIVYKNDKEEIIYSPHKFPDHGSYEKVLEPWVFVKIILPTEYLSQIMQLLHDHEAEIGETESMGLGRAALNIKMPLREMMRNFFDELKSASSGYASISYKIGDFREADVVRLDILVGGEIAAAFSRIVSRQKMETEAEKTVEKLYNILPRQMFVTKIQGQAAGRIISSRTLSALKKDVTQHMYGGDITRKMKLREKQKKGKKKMAERGRVNIPQDVFMKMMRSGE